jgi:hypothetical protein
MSRDGIESGDDGARTNRLLFSIRDGIESDDDGARTNRLLFSIRDGIESDDDGTLVTFAFGALGTFALDAFAFGDLGTFAFGVWVAHLNLTKRDVLGTFL